MPQVIFIPRPALSDYEMWVNGEFNTSLSETQYNWMRTLLTKLEVSWSPHKVLYEVNLESGDKRLIVKDLRCNPRLSPATKYIAWWSDPDSAWFAWNASTATIARLTDNRTVPFYDEEFDVPDYPNEHGLAGWLAWFSRKLR